MENNINDEKDQLIKEFFDEEDKKIKGSYDSSFYLEKINKLYEFREKNKYINFISIDEFDTIYEFAITKGGFLSSKDRRFFYPIICGINKSNVHDYVYIDENENHDWSNDLLRINAFYIRNRDDNRVGSPDEKIINLDVLRSKITFILQEAKCGTKYGDRLPVIDRAIKISLEKFIVNMTSLNNHIYTYYQGYHDLGLYFLLLFNDDKSTGTSIFQHFSEFILKENLQSKENLNTEIFPMVNTLKILKEIIEIINPNIQNFINKVMNEGLSTFATPWILSLFTHCISSTKTVYRLLDYFIITHPLSVYIISALIIIDEILRINRTNGNVESIGTECDLFKYFNSFDMDSIDYDYYIEKAEKIKKQFKDEFDDLRKKLRQMKMKNYYPLVVKESYIKKWIMYNNKDEINTSFNWFLKKGKNYFFELFDKS